MHIIAGFQSNKFLEMAIQEVEESGINSEKIVVVEMKDQAHSPQLFDSIHYSDGSSLLDGMAPWSAVGALLGVVWGSQVTIGPIAAGLLSFIVGASFGYFIDKILGHKRKTKKFTNYIDFIIIINCTKDQHKNTASILKQYHAASIGYHG